MSRNIIKCLGGLVCLGVCLGVAMPGFSQEEAAEEEPVVIQWPNFPLPQIILNYEAITGLNVIQDAAIQTATLSIQTTKPMIRTEAAQFIEKSLLLNGFAIVPAGSGTVKIVAVPKEQGQARSEGLEIYSDVADLPLTDQLVAFVMKFKHLGAEQAASALADIFPSHSYGSIVPFPQAGSIVITDSTSVVRRYVEMQEHLDVAPTELDISMSVFPLERADAETVAASIEELLSLESSSPANGSQSSQGRTPVPNPRLPGIQSRAQSSTGDASNFQSPDAESLEPKVRADVRTNSVIAVAEAQDLAYIETLVKFLDAPAATPKFLKRQLNFMSVSTFLPIAQNALMPGIQEQGSSGNISGGETDANASQNQSGGGNLGGGGGSSGRGLGAAQFTSDIGPESLVVGKTLLIGDNIHNTLIASGPQEHLDVISELLDEMDRRPRQIQISAVIAQLTLGNDVDFAADLFRTINTSNLGDRFAGSIRNRSQGTPELNTLDTVTNLLPAAQGLTLYGQISALNNAYLNTLQSKNEFRVLARPTIYTLNNRWGAISTGQRIAVPSSTLSTVDPGNLNQAINSSISFEEVLLQVRVLPLINSKDEVTLLIDQVNDDIVGSQNISGNDIPTIGTQQLFTTVIVPNGGTVLLGGLISEDNRKTDTGLPVFVTLPLVGPLFGSASHEKNRQELLIFIQPRIIEEDAHTINAQADFKARSQFYQDVEQFSAPKVTSQAKSKNIVKRLFQWRLPRKKTEVGTHDLKLEPEVKD